MMKIKLFLAFIPIIFFSVSIFAAVNPLPPLPADKAFVFAMYTDPAAPAKPLIAEWQMAPGYHLYRDRLKITLSPSSAKGEFLQKKGEDLPPGEVKADAMGEKRQVYSGRLRVPVALPRAADDEWRLVVDYQGCSQQGFCYPPMQKSFSFHLSQLSPLPPVQGQTALTNQSGVNLMLQTQHLGFLLLFFLGLGLLLALTPCVLPMVPILAGIIIGQEQPVHMKKAFFLSLSYVLGMAVTYACAGIFAALFGSLLQAWLQKPWIIASFSGMFVLLAFSLFGFYELRLPSRFGNSLTFWSHQQKAGTYLGVSLMGVLSTLIVSPCVTAPLVGVLIYIGQTGDTVLGAGALFTMGIGMGIPLLLVGISAGKWLPKRGPWMLAVKKVCGLMMLGMAVWLLLRVVSPMGEGAFSVVQDMRQLENALAVAKSKNQGVLLDFYADWCAACVAMDRQVFAAPHIQKVLKNFVLLRADISANNSAHQAVLKRFKVIAPPTILFFDEQGRELESQRIIGEVGSQEFLARLALQKGKI